MYHNNTSCQRPPPNHTRLRLDCQTHSSTAWCNHCSNVCLSNSLVVFGGLAESSRGEMSDYTRTLGVECRCMIVQACMQPTCVLRLCHIRAHAAAVSIFGKVVTSYFGNTTLVHRSIYTRCSSHTSSLVSTLICPLTVNSITRLH